MINYRNCNYTNRIGGYYETYFWQNNEKQLVQSIKLKFHAVQKKHVFEYERYSIRKLNYININYENCSINYVFIQKIVKSAH